MIYLVTPSNITVFFPGHGPMHTPKSNPEFEALRAALQAKNDTEVRRICFPYERPTFKSANLTLENGKIMFGGKPLHPALAQRLLNAAKRGIHAPSLEAFVKNTLQNPSYRSVVELYGFLEANNLPITEDGCFLAYKRVKEDFTDCHTGTVDNRPGTRVRMPRNEVDDDCENTCSYGLHVCSLPYLEHFSGTRLVVTKVNPRDVVSVPKDYENSKMRVCEYLVLEEIPLDTVHSTDKQWASFTPPTPNLDLADESSDTGEDEDPDEDPDKEGASPYELLRDLRISNKLNPDQIENSFFVYNNESIPLVHTTLTPLA